MSGRVLTCIALAGGALVGPRNRAERPRAAGAVAGRYVRVEHWHAFLGMAEVEVFSGGDNVATKGTATQSSLYREGFEAGVAIDGVTGGRSCNHSKKEDASWWEVDLGRELPIYRIVVWNRANRDIHGRFSGAMVKVLDAKRKETWSHRIRTVLGHYDLHPSPAPPPAAPVTAGPVVEEGRLVLARDGRALVNLVADTPRNVFDALALEDLEHYLEAVTGAEIPVLVGKPAPSGACCIRMATTDLPERAWRVQADDRGLVLSGGGVLGTAYAVWHFLEDSVGVRWWSAREEYIPRQATLTVPRQLARSGEHPVVVMAMNVGRGLHVRNRVVDRGGFAAPWLQGRMGHNISHIMKPAVYAAEHPEWYALVDGKRLIRDFWRGELCYSAGDGLVEAFAQAVAAQSEKSDAETRRKGAPRRLLCSVMRMDNAPWCECDACLAAYRASSRSAVYLRFINAVARRLQDLTPDLMLVHGAYQHARTAPPATELEPNFMPQYCTERLDRSAPLSDERNGDVLSDLEGWHAAGDALAVWYYSRTYARWQGSYDSRGVSVRLGPDWPVNSLHAMPELMQTLRDMGLRTFLFENEDNFLQRDSKVMKDWVGFKLAEDPDANYGALLHEFTDGYYGAAGPHVRRYLDRLFEAQGAHDDADIWFFADMHQATYLTLDTCLSLYAIQDAAEAAVEDDALHCERVRFWRASTIDRMLVFKRPIFAREWRRRQGQGEEPFPVSRADLRRRAEEAGRWYIDLTRDNTLEPTLTAYLEFIDAMDSAGAPLPERFADVAPCTAQILPGDMAWDFTTVEAQKVNEFSAPSTAAATVERVLATDALCGEVLRFTGAGDTLACHYQPSWGKAPRDSGPLTLADLPADTWTWVKLGQWAFPTTNAGLILESGEARLRFWAGTVAPGTYEVWAHLRATRDEKRPVLDLEQLVLIGKMNHEQ